MEPNKDDIARPIDVTGIADPNMNIDPKFRKHLSDFLIKGTNLKDHRKHSFQPALTKIIPVRNFKKDPRVRKELRHKFRQLLKENSSDPQEKLMLYHETVHQLDKQKKKIVKTIKLNHRRGQLRKIWESKGNKKILQSHESKDTFDMKSLKKSLPSKWNDNDIKNKAEKVSKKFLSIIEKKKQSFRKKEIVKGLYSYAPELCTSSKLHQCKSINLALEKVFGDAKNVHAFAFKPLTKSYYINDKEISIFGLPKVPISHKEEMQNEKTFYTMNKEVIVFMKYQSAEEAKTTSQSYKNENGPSLNAENLQNPEGIQFVSDQWNDEQLRNGSLQTQLGDSVSLASQLSRLKITNSRTLGNTSHEP